MMPPEYTQDLDEVIRDLEGRIAVQEQRRQEEAQHPHPPVPLDGGGVALIKKMTQSRAGTAVLALVGEGLAHSIKRDLKERPARLVLKGIIGAVVAGALANHYSKKTGL